MRPTRIGIVGAGNVARRHVQCLAAFGDVELVGVADSDIDRALLLADQYGGHAYDSHEAMLEASAPDAVYLCVPPFAHGAAERAVIAAGLPFFVEKPLAIDVGTAEQIAAAVTEAGTLTATGYWWRYLDTVDQARALLAGDQPLLAVGTWLDKVPPPAWWLRRDQSGGQLIEQATHVVDLLRVLVGEIDSVWATSAASSLPDADVDAVTAATLRFRSGAVGSLVSTCVLGWKHLTGVQVYAADLAMELTDTVLKVTRGTDVQSLVPQVDAKMAADRAFIDAVRGEPGDIRAPYAEALNSHRVACALAESAHTGHVVHLDQADSELAGPEDARASTDSYSSM